MGTLNKKVPYYIKDPKTNPNFDNHPYVLELLASSGECISWFLFCYGDAQTKCPTPPARKALHHIEAGMVAAIVAHHSKHVAILLPSLLCLSFVPMKHG